MAGSPVRTPVAPFARVPRARVGDALGESILTLLWEEIPQHKVPQMADRLRRLEAVLDAVSDYDAGALLARLSAGGDLYRDFEYRLSTPTRRRLRERLRQRMKQRLPARPPVRTTVPPPPAPVPQPVSPPPASDPTPAPVRPSSRRMQLVSQFVWKSKPARRLASRGVFDVMAELEAEGTASAHVTDAELATVKAKWIKGSGPGGEIETKFSQWFLPDVKLEGDSGKWTASFKKDVALAGGRIVLTPHVQVSDEIFLLEVAAAPFKVTVKFWNTPLHLTVELKGNLIVKVDAGRLLKELVKKKVRDIGKRLLDELVDFLGDKVVGSAVRRIATVLLGGTLARIIFGDATKPVITPDPDDVGGHEEALQLSGGASSSMALLQQWATTHRRAFAKSYGDTLRELLQQNGVERLRQLRTGTGLGYKALPAASAPLQDWQIWANTRKALATISLEYRSDDFVRRFRWYELALMMAAAAYILRKITKDELEEVAGVCSVQASLAGIAAAVQYTERRIRENSYEFVDERGNVVRRSGIDHWRAIGEIVRQAGLTDEEIGVRLQPQGLEMLPPLPGVA